MSAPRRDPVSAALKALLLAGHIAALGLLGIAAGHQLGGGPLPDLAAATAPDTEPPGAT
ncbi:hypothetical protein AB0F71_15225 [Kitasatospora sp. NPDC028055]|uniref:hypothetical protein n=1 Tax=Kitasatospora sp. NPDC028055 TaxID=3155653 RepID=UPI0033E9A061